MIEREAFETWWEESEFKLKGPAYKRISWLAWQAACAYQRKKDAEICDKISEMPRDPEYSAGAHYCGHAIRNQGDE